jgi:two-component system response regulator CpxR
MRPKKVILLVDQDQQTLSERRFLLVTHGYNVVAAAGPKQAVEIYVNPRLDLTLIAQPDPELAEQLKRLRPHIKVLMLAENPQAACADVVLNPKTCSPQQLLEWIKTMTARKRGPRKGTWSPVTPAISEISTGFMHRPSATVQKRR